MKTRFLFTILSIVMCCACYAQDGFEERTNYFPDNQCLGIWRTISVDVANTPTTGGYFKFTIDVPPEGVHFGGLQGPANAYLLNNLGSTVDVYVNKMKLIMAILDTEEDSVPLEFFVDAWVDPTTGYIRSYQYPIGSRNNQCYYYLVFNLYNVPN